MLFMFSKKGKGSMPVGCGVDSNIDCKGVSVGACV